MIMTPEEAKEVNHKEFYSMVRSQIEHEDSLVNHRLTWLLMINGFLFSALGFSFAAEATGLDKGEGFCSKINHARDGLAMLGFLSSLILLIGILAASASIHNLMKQWNNVLNKLSNSDKINYPQIIGNYDKLKTGKSIIVWGGFLPSWLLPVLICVTWFIIQPSFIYFFNNNFVKIFMIILISVLIFLSGRYSKDI
jgi:hypothetical protein